MDKGGRRELRIPTVMLCGSLLGWREESNTFIGEAMLENRAVDSKH